MSQTLRPLFLVLVLAPVLGLVWVGACQRAEAPPVTQSPPAPGDAAARPTAVTAAPPKVNPLVAERMAEVQAIVDTGSAPSRLAQFIAGRAAEPEALFARKTALAVLRTERARPVRLAALIQAGSATPVAPADDALWPELVGALSETWAAENSAAGRRRMVHEKDLRARLLLVSSLATYAASNRGLSELTMPQRRVLRAEFMGLYPKLPRQQQQEIDAFVARFNVNGRGTL